MAPNLPQGLVANSSQIAGDIRSVYSFSPEDFQRLWKVYNINKDILANDVGFRLEHMFWRIWGCERLRSRVNGALASRLFDEICDGRGFRTTPVPSPRVASVVPVVFQPSDSPNLVVSDEFEPLPSTSAITAPLHPSHTGKGKERDSAISDEPGSVQSRRSSQVDSSSVQFSLPTERPSLSKKVEPPPNRPKIAVPQSILKKPRQQSQPQSASDLARIREEPAIAQAIQEDPSLSGCSTVSDISPTSGIVRKTMSPTYSSNGRNGNGSRKKRSSFAVGNGGRKRPSFARRKSSQSSASGTTPRSQSLSTVGPSSSLGTSQVTTPSGGSLVDRDFRTNVAKVQRREDQFTHFRRQSNPKTLSTVASTSAAVSGTLALGDGASDVKGRGKARAIFTESEVSSSSYNSGESSSREPLLRTKSQLTLLLQRDRKRSGTSERDSASS
ncbi:MAG: hypothetical protein M1814_001586 [Vezdaea aestivalis]|nr:MAG: hypothetical protein M1814_001586 [Vezdaea aestivalis]